MNKNINLICLIKIYEQILWFSSNKDELCNHSSPENEQLKDH